MANRQRRQLVWVLAVGVMVVATVLFVVAARSHRREDVRHFAAVATFDAQGHAQIDETIDYFFALPRHGIYRNIDDIPYHSDAKITFASGATDQARTVPFGDGIQLIFGDESRTVKGAQWYTIAYPLATLDRGNGVFSWNGVGADWDVPIRATELDLVAPWRWRSPKCDLGTTGTRGGCTATQPEPGHLVVSVDRELAPGEGVTISARRGTALAAAPSPRHLSPYIESGDFTDRLALVWLTLVSAAVMAMLLVTRSLRWVGRDRIIAASNVDVVFAGAEATKPDAPQRRMDDARLAALAATSVAPPRGLEPWQGAIVAAEEVTERAGLAWLLGAVASGHLNLDDGDAASVPPHPVISPGPVTGDETAALLATGFADRPSITLGVQDADFAAMWAQVREAMAEWSQAAQIRDPAGTRRVVAARIAAVVFGLVGVVGLWSSALRVEHVGAGPFVLAALAGAFGFAGLVLWFRAWELLVRTPKGVAWWIQIESFRKFLRGSEAAHVRDALARGVLREYTAWAVALDEVTAWSQVAVSAGIDPALTGMVLVTPTQVSAASERRDEGWSPAVNTGSTITRSRSSDRPSRSASPRRGGGGGVGSGGGGGGGGSW